MKATKKVRKRNRKAPDVWTQVTGTASETQTISHTVETPFRQYLESDTMKREAEERESSEEKNMRNLIEQLSQARAATAAEVERAQSELRAEHNQELRGMVGQLLTVVADLAAASRVRGEK